MNNGALRIGGAEYGADQLPELEGLVIVQNDPFKCKPRKRLVKKLLLHESVTSDPDVVSPTDTTERVLRKRGLGVHLMIGPDGTLVQHNDLSSEYPNHASNHNVDSVGLELVNPYYGDRWKASQPWPKPITAPWAHKKKYIPPTLAQMVTLCKLVRSICNVSLGWLEIPADLVGIVDNGAGIAMKPLGMTKKDIRSTPGIWAHGWTEHADGYFAALVLALMLHTDATDSDAYERALKLATGARGFIRFNPQPMV